MTKIEREFRILMKNKPGALLNLCGILKNSDINIKAVVSELRTQDEGAVRIITDSEEKTKNILEKHKIPFGIHDVLVETLIDRPGELEKVCKALADAKVNIDFIYFFGKDDAGRLLVAISPNSMDSATQAMKEIKW
jgi:hypothetical protein